MEIKVIINLLLCVIVLAIMSADGRVDFRKMHFVYNDIMPSTQAFQLQQKQALVHCIISCQMKPQCWAIAFKYSQCHLYDNKFTEEDEIWLEGKGFNYKYIEGNSHFKEAKGYKYYEMDQSPERRWETPAGQHDGHQREKDSENPTPPGITTSSAIPTTPNPITTTKMSNLLNQITQRPVNHVQWALPEEEFTTQETTEEIPNINTSEQPTISSAFEVTPGLYFISRSHKGTKDPTPDSAEQSEVVTKVTLNVKAMPLGKTEVHYLLNGVPVTPVEPTKTLFVRHLDQSTRSPVTPRPAINGTDGTTTVIKKSEKITITQIEDTKPFQTEESQAEEPRKAAVEATEAPGQVVAKEDDGKEVRKVTDRQIEVEEYKKVIITVRRFQDSSTVTQESSGGTVKDTREDTEPARVTVTKENTEETANVRITNKIFQGTTLETVTNENTEEPANVSITDNSFQGTTLDTVTQKSTTETTMDTVTQKSVVETAMDNVTQKSVVDTAMDNVTQKSVVETAMDNVTQKSVVETAMDNVTQKSIVETAMDNVTQKSVVETATGNVTQETSDGLATVNVTQQVNDDAITSTVSQPENSDVKVKEESEGAVNMDLALKSLDGFKISNVTLQNTTDSTKEKSIAETAMDTVTQMSVVETAMDTATQKSNVEAAMDTVNQTSNVETAMDTVTQKSNVETAMDTVNQKSNVETAMDTVTQKSNVETPMDTVTQKSIVETAMDTANQTTVVETAMDTATQKSVAETAMDTATQKSIVEMAMDTVTQKSTEETTIGNVTQENSDVLATVNVTQQVNDDAITATVSQSENADVKVTEQENDQSAKVKEESKGAVNMDLTLKSLDGFKISNVTLQNTADPVNEKASEEELDYDFQYSNEARGDTDEGGKNYDESSVSSSESKSSYGSSEGSGDDNQNSQDETMYNI